MDSLWEILLLFFTGFLVGIINTISGGGSLLTLPVLIFIGLPSAVANGSNRIAILVQNIFALAGYRSKGLNVPRPFSWYITVSAIVGAVIGAQFAVTVKDALFNKILAVVMVVIILFMALQSRKNHSLLQEKLEGKPRLWATVAFFIIGLYAGFIQAGTGIFILLTLAAVNHITLIKANVIKAVVMFFYTVAALFMFGFYGKLDWAAGLTLASGQALSAWYTSRWSVNQNDRIVKIFLVVMVSGMAIRLWFFS